MPDLIWKSWHKKRSDFLDTSWAEYGQKTLLNFLFHVFFLSPSHRPIPPLFLRLLTHPVLHTPLLPFRFYPQTLAFLYERGLTRQTIQSVFSRNKPVGEGSVESKPERLEQRGAQPLVISLWSGTRQPSAPNTQPCCSPAWPDWLTHWVSLHSLSLFCPAPSLLLSTLESESAQIGKVLLRPAPGSLEDSIERIFPLSFTFILSLGFAVSSKHVVGLCF